MRQDVTELKKLVHNLMLEKGQTSSPMGNMNYYPQSIPNLVSSQPAVVPTINVTTPSVQPRPVAEDIHDTAEYVEESLSLDDLEKDMIRKALDKHHGKRKDAAKDLNISERTLYRKIKEYGLD